MFIFVRHGQTMWNPSLINIGHCDYELTPEGIQQADRCGQLLTRYPNINTIYTSPLKRALQTTEIINKYLAYNVITIENLQEKFYGDQSTPAETNFTERVVATCNQLLQTTQPCIIVSHAGVFKTIVNYLCHTNESINFAEAYIFECIDGKWSYHRL